MDVVTSRSFARAGFLGNPSDGYYGKTISFAHPIKYDMADNRLAIIS